MKFLSLFLFSALIWTVYTPSIASASKFTANSIQNGDNLLIILKRQGFSQKQREEVLSLHKGIRSIFLTLDTRYLLSTSNDETELRIYDSQADAAFRIIKNNHEVRVEEYKPNFSIQTISYEGKIHGSILGSILAKVPSNWVGSRFLDAFAFDMKTPRDVNKGAEFSFAVEKLYDQGKFIKYGEITEASLELRGSVVNKTLIRQGNSAVFVNANDVKTAKELFAPVGYVKIASRFKPNRLHPITKRRQAHLGVDFELPVGEIIYAPRSGRVVRYGRNRAAGNFVVLLHSNGAETSYNHMNSIDSKIRTGLLIKAGEKIGQVGCTGYCTRAHLHFALKINGKMVDPMKYLKSYPAYMDASLRKRFAAN